MENIKFRIWNEDKTEYSISTLNEAIGGMYYEDAVKSQFELFTGMPDKNNNEICEGDIIEHGDFYWQEGSSEDWFGTEPQVSWHVIEAYPERRKSVVIYENGAFRLKTLHFNSKTKERYDVGLLCDYINSDWDKVKEFEILNPDEHKDNLEAGDFETTKDMIDYLLPVEIIDNLNSFEKTKAGGKN